MSSVSPAVSAISLPLYHESKPTTHGVTARPSSWAERRAKVSASLPSLLRTESVALSEADIATAEAVPLSPGKPISPGTAQEVQLKKPASKHGNVERTVNLVVPDFSPTSRAASLVDTARPSSVLDAPYLSTLFDAKAPSGQQSTKARVGAFVGTAWGTLVSHAQRFFTATVTTIADTWSQVASFFSVAARDARVWLDGTLSQRQATVDKLKKKAARQRARTRWHAPLKTEGLAALPAQIPSVRTPKGPRPAVVKRVSFAESYADVLAKGLPTDL